MAEPKLSKAGIAFLRKVEAKKVFAWMSYSAQRGGYFGFTGGEATARKYEAAGFVRMGFGASIGKRAYVELTDAGRAALEALEAKDHG